MALCRCAACTGGWKFVQCRPDRSMPLERNHLTMIEEAVGEDIKLDEIEQFFPDDLSKKSMSGAQKSRSDVTSTPDVRACCAIRDGCKRPSDKQA